MSGDRELCIAAGMNGYLTKPIDVKVLFSTLSQWAPERTDIVEGISSQTAVDNVTTTEDIELPGVDITDGLSHMGGNRKLYRRIISKFREGQADAVEQIREALQAGDVLGAMRIAHTLKGVAGNIGALDVVAAAQHVEETLRETLEAEAEKVEIEPLLAAVSAALQPLLQAIAEMEEPAPSATNGATAPAAQQSAPVDIAALRPLLDKLEDLLKRSNTGAREVIAELSTQVPEAGGRDILTAMSNDISSYDFQAAQARWPELMQCLEGNGSDNGQNGQPTPIDLAELRPLLDKLQDFLKRSNTGAREVLAELNTRLSDSGSRDILTAMSNDINSYDFQAAQARWPELMHLLEGNSNG
jgi:two-component system sensor histidine kinase/response regulator